MPQNDDWVEDLYAEGAADQPPSDLDAKILTAAAQASQAVHVPTQQRGSRRYVGWATAALVLLTVGVLFNSELLFLPDPASDIDVRTRVPAEQPNQTPGTPSLMQEAARDSEAPEVTAIEEVVVTAEAVRQRADEPMPASSPPPAAATSDLDSQETGLRSTAYRRLADSNNGVCDEREVFSGYRACQGPTGLLVQHMDCTTPLQLFNASLQASNSEGALLRQQDVLYKATCVKARWVVETQ